MWRQPIKPIEMKRLKSGSEKCGERRYCAQVAVHTFLYGLVGKGYGTKKALKESNRYAGKV